MTEQLQKTFLGSKVLITGHTGFKGSWLSIWLSKMGAKVTGLSLDIPTEPSHFLSGHIPELLSNDVRLDIRNGLSIKNLLKQLQPDFVFHLAAQPIVRRSYIEPIESWQINTLGTVNILESLR